MIVIIDYGIGNTGSVVNALNKLRIPNRISSDPFVLKKAKGLILPGVGAAKQGMENLKKRNLDEVIIREIRNGKPFLGICLGMQLLFEQSEEGNIRCLGFLEGRVKKFTKVKKIPQIGWNNIEIQNVKIEINPPADGQKLKNLFEGIPDKSYFYFVNSYYCEPHDQSIVLGKTTYGESFSSIVVKDNIVGVQFHPEKSSNAGFTLLNNFFKYYVN